MEKMKTRKHIVNIIRILFFGLFLFLVTQGKMIIWLALFAASLIAALFFGRIFCGYICPMNTVMRPVAWLSRKLKIQTDKSPRFLKSGWLAIVILAVSLPAMMLTRRVLQREIPILLIFLVLSILVTIRYKPEVFHNMLCPFGVLQRITGRFAIYSETVSADACIGCKKCENVCPGEAIKVNPANRKAEINKTLCHQCQDCVMVCPTKAISYKRS